jgi:hypothetical protein
MKTTIETKGKSKVTKEQVIAMRKLAKKNPDLTMQAIKDQLKLKLSTIMVGRCIRGISHSHIDMCGLPIRPFNTGDAKKPAKKKAAPKNVGKKSVAPKKTAAKLNGAKFVDLPAVPVVQG